MTFSFFFFDFYGFREEGKKEDNKKKRQSKKSGGEKVKLNLRLDHQVQFGEHVGVLGSVKEFGSWKEKVMMNWTENGWVCNLEMERSEGPIEYKFVIAGKDNKLHWENGDNRILKLPEKGSFNVVCKWDNTREHVELLPFEEEDMKEVEVKGSENGNAVSPALDEAATTSTFVEQWQGKGASFHRSKDNLDAEKRTNWDTSGLSGISLKLVEGDRSGRNWWRKV